MDFFAKLILGHLVGDYVFQNTWMAMNKSGSSFKCFIHCLIYTASVCLIMFDFRISWIVLVFLSHYFIDRYSLADKWLYFFKSRSLKDFLANGEKNIPEGDNKWKWNYYGLRAGFTSFVYIATDNTFHLLLMYYGYLLLRSL
jgi:hypothetical protein